MTKNKFSKIIILTIVWTFIVQPFLYIIDTWPIEKAAAADIYANSIVKTVNDDWSNEPISGETGEAKGTLIGKLNSLSEKLDDLKFFAFLDNNKINLDAYDLSQLLIYKNIATRLNNDLSLMAAYKEDSGKVIASLLEEMGVQSLPTYDIRTIQALIKLVTPRELGGDGREYIKVSSIVKGFRSDKQAQSGAETSQEQLAEDSENYFSPHNTGQAADITQIDYLRGTRKTTITTKQTGALGTTEKTQNFYEKLPKIPIDVSWQGGALGNGQGGNLNSKSMNGLFEMPLQFISSGLQNWLADQGIDLNNLQVDSKNLANLPFSIALPQFIETLGLPSNYTPGFNFGDQIAKTGSSAFVEATGGTLPINGLRGSTPKELFTNLGREKITELLELPTGSLQGNNSSEVISKIGRRKMEEELKIGPDVLVNISNAEDLIQKIGQGLIERTFSLESGSFSGNDLNKIKTKLAIKWNEFIEKPILTDNRLMISIGETQKLMNGSISPAGYKQEVGQGVLDNLTSSYSPRMLGASLGIEQPSPEYPVGSGKDNFFSQENLNKNNNLKNYFDNQTLAGRFLKGDDSVFRDIGAETLARTIGTDQTNTDAYGEPLNDATGNRSFFKQWLATGNVPRITKDSADYPSFDLEAVAAKLGLRSGDLENIFIKNDTNLRNEIFYRIGYDNLAESISTPKTTADTSWNNFYLPRLNNIASLAKSLKSTKIQNIVQQIKDYESTSQENLSKEMQYDPQSFARKKMTEIQSELLAIESKSPKDKIDQLRLNINEIIEERELININNLKSTDITFSKPINLTSDFNKNLLDTLQSNKGSIDNLLLNVGAGKWAGILGVDDSNDLIDIANAAKNNPSGASDTIRNKLSSGVLNNLAAQINNGMGSLNYSSGIYQVSGIDMANFFAGNVSSTLIKIGSPVINQAMQFPAGMGLSEYYQNGSLDADTLLKDGGICRLYGFLGLGTPDIQKGQSDEDKIANLTRSYVENQLGLARGSLNANSFDELLSKNGKERTLLAFGVQISADILIDKDKNPQRYQQRIDDLINQVKDTHSALWSNSQISGPIQQALARSDTGLSYDALRNMLDGKVTPRDLAQSAKEILGHKISENNPDGSSKLKDYLGLVIDYASGTDNAISQLGEAFKNGDVAGAFDKLASITSANVDLKLNLGDQNFTIGRGVFSSLLRDPQKAPQIVLSRGMSILSNIIKTGDNKTTAIIHDLLAGVVNQVGTEPFDLNKIIPNEDNIFSVLYKHGVGQVTLNGQVSAFGQTYTGAIPIDLLHPLKNIIDTSLLPNNQKPLANFQNIYSGMIMNEIQKGTKIPTIDLKDINQKINDNLKFYDGEIGNAIRCWSSAGLKTAYDDLMKNSSIKPGDPNYQDVLSYETIRAAYLDPLLKYPVSTSEYRETQKLIDETEKLNNIKFSPEDRQAIFDEIYQQKRIEESKLAQKNVRYASVDLAVYKLGVKDKWMTRLGPGFARTMMEGDATAKTAYFRGFLGRAVDNLDDLDPTAKTVLQGFLSDPNYDINSNLTGIAGSKVDQVFNKWTCGAGTCAVGSGLGRAMLEYMKNPSGAQLSGDLVNSQLSGMLDTTLKMPGGTTLSIYNGFKDYQQSLNNYHRFQNTPFGSDEYKSGVIARSKNALSNKTADLCILAANIALSKTFSDIDSKLGLPNGTTSTLVSAAAYSMIAHTSYATALTKLVPKTNFSAVGMALAVGIGLITGSISPQQAVYMVAGAMVGQMAGKLIGSLIGGPLGTVLGQVIGQIIGGMVNDLLMGKPETTITSTVLYTAGGYYPFYEKERIGCICGDKNSCNPDGREQSDCDNLQIANGQHLDGVDEIYNKAIQNNKIINENTAVIANGKTYKNNYEYLQFLKQQYDIIPSQEVDLIDQLPAMFHGENNEAFSAGMKPVADYKIKILLGNLLTLDDNKSTSNINLLPTQIQTYQRESVVYWNTTRDRVYGNGTAGSADKNLESSRKGLGWNPNLFDRVHFSY